MVTAKIKLCNTPGFHLDCVLCMGKVIKFIAADRINIDFQ